MTTPNHPVSSDDSFARLRTAIVADIKQHVDSLRQSNVEFYGYAVLPPDYRTAAFPASLVIAFNTESDIASENRGEPYYRYSVDEWQNYVHEGFDRTNAELKSLLLATAPANDPDDFQIDNAFVGSVYQAVLNALQSLQNDGIFSHVAYLVIWLSDSGDDIMNRSAKLLNSQEIYAEFASEFAE